MGFPACCCLWTRWKSSRWSRQGNAEAGRNPGGVANLVLKSGTNAFHGALTTTIAMKPWPLALHSRLPAPKPEDPQPAIRSLGSGPIRRDKTFFEASFERQSFVIGIQSTSLSLPRIIRKRLPTC